MATGNGCCRGRFRDFSRDFVIFRAELRRNGLRKFVGRFLLIYVGDYQ
jgi:hypothetical protein